MQTKLSKHFIYSWLNEDAFGEFLLHGFYTSLHTHKLLLNTWKLLLFKSSTFQGITSLYSPKFLPFTLAVLRKRFIYNYFLRDSIIADNTFLFNNYTWYKLFFLNQLIFFKWKKLNKTQLKKKFSIINLRKLKVVKHRFISKKVKNFSWFKYIYLIKRRRRQFFIMRNKKLLISGSQLHNLKGGFIRRGNPFNKKIRHILKLSKKFNISSKIRKFAFKKKFYSFRTRQRFFSLPTQLRRYKNLCFLYTRKKKYGIVRRSLIPLSLWRFFSSIKKKLNKKIITRLNNLTKLAQKQNFSNNWDSLAHRLRVKTYKFLNSRRAKKKNFQPKFMFSGFFKKLKIPVKKNEKVTILKFRLMHYFNFVTGPRDFSLLEKKFPLFAKNLRLPTLSYLEFKLSTLLVRSNFFENGYIVASLAKRGLFLVNGNIVIGNVAIQVWDFITMVKSLWWVVYARFINYFLLFFKSYELMKKKIMSLPKPFLKKIFNSRWLLKKFRKVKNLKGKKLSKIVSSKNFILSLPPAYMEVSYSLLTVLIHKLVSVTEESTYAPQLQNVKNFLPITSTPVNAFLKLPY